MHRSVDLLDDEPQGERPAWIADVLRQVRVTQAAEDAADQDWLAGLPEGAQRAALRARALARTSLPAANARERHCGPALSWWRSGSGRSNALLLEDDSVPVARTRCRYTAAHVEHARALRIFAREVLRALRLFADLLDALLCALAGSLDDTAHRAVRRNLQPPPAVRGRQIANLSLTPRLVAQRPLLARC